MAKATLPAPIDRPLSRAYLRKFTGWATADPPGVSDPGSLRVMENVLINREGSARVRPGLRRLTDGGITSATQLCSSHEPFYLNNGKKAFLLAVRETVSGTTLVTFRVGIQDAATGAIAVVDLLHPEAAFTIPAGMTQPAFTAATTYVRFLQIDNKVLALSNAGESLFVFHVGAVKKVSRATAIPDPDWGSSRGWIDMPPRDWIIGPQDTIPGHAVDFSSTNSIAQAYGDSHNVYNYAFTYTFSNELGETAPAAIAQFKAQRAWGSLLWLTPDLTTLGTQTSTPSINPTSVGSEASDQLSLLVPGGHFYAGRDAGAQKINFYLMCWSDQSPVPVEMQLIGSRDITPTSTAEATAWFMVTPATQGLGQTIPIPTLTNRANLNTTAPSKAGQGLVAADRLVLVNDPTRAAVIQWTTNAPGEYLNFASTKGGGYKTLTSGNMQVPACVKLWQNPQSADTLTILCMGTDGHSSAYYMAPASVSSQSDNTQIMGFEETTATPGTVSPYGCEVANNALYHPLDDQLMKSTASNYNITHKSMTDAITPEWQGLVNKKKIVSCFFDQRLYFLVHNPEGVALPAGCSGNEVWVLDLSSEGGSWSRWLTPGVSLKKVEAAGRLMLGLMHPTGMYVFDEKRGTDDFIEGGAAGTRPIPWKLETNTQGANRAHDAWAHLRQVSLTLGSFTGRMRYGIRGLDMNGRWIEVEKVYAQHEHVLGEDLPFDAEDHLHVARELKEWFFFASSTETDGVVDASFGQLSLAQYRYTPVSVNVGYDYGQVETFEYGRAVAGAESLTTNGVPQPYLDTRRP